MPEALIRTASHKWQPQIIIGIDFGMTCTGVAYALLDPSSTSVPEPKNIQKWLGPSNTHLDDKVPTELIYTDRHENAVNAWGSHCRNKNLRSYVKHSFKLSIASKATNVAAYGHDTSSARRYFKDYVTEVCAYVEDCLAKWVPKYRSLRVEFIFSVPVTWEFDTETLNEVKSTVRGIVGVSQTRRAEIGLTEAAAAAVDIGRNKFDKGDVILVCDTGGGTTDINVVKMLSARGEIARLNPLTYDEGISVGSTRIDRAALKFLLSTVREVRGVDFPALAEEAIYGQFQEVKHDYGTDTSNKSFYLLPIPSLTVNDNLPVEHFQGTSFKIPAKTIKAWFDEEIDQIIALGEKQLRTLHEGHKKEKIRWMVLSGGFGQNQYVRDRLKEYLRSIPTSKDSAVEPEVDVLTADNPQLAVVRGLVYNRAQEMLGLTPIYEQVCCRMSYGIVVQEEYNKKRHQGQIPRKSDEDGKLWVHGQIDWIIKQGILVPSTGMSKTYEWALADSVDENEEEEEETWTCHIVSCEHPRAHLPLNISHKEVKSVCKLEVDLDKLAYRIRRRSLLKKETAYRIVKFDLLILIGAADLRFQVHPRGETDTLASKEHEDIDVVWMREEEAANVVIPSSEGKQPALSGSQSKGKSKTSLTTHFKKPKWV